MDQTGLKIPPLQRITQLWAVSTLDPILTKGGHPFNVKYFFLQKKSRVIFWRKPCKFLFNLMHFLAHLGFGFG